MDKSRKICIVLDKLRSAHNTGNVFRIAEALNAEVICCGYTPFPPHPKLEKTAMNSDKMVVSRHVETSVDAINLLREENYAQILAAEPAENAVEAWEKDYKFPLAIIFGNEALGIAPEALEMVDGLVALPMLGEKASINVGNSVAAIMYAVDAKSRGAKL